MIVTLSESVNSSVVLCDFIRGSNASGCVVTLKSVYGNESHALTRNSALNSATLAVTLEHPPTCYQQVEALDVEWNGVVGSLALPGELIRNFSDELPCPSKNLPGWGCTQILTVVPLVGLLMFYHIAFNTP